MKSNFLSVVVNFGEAAGKFMDNKIQIFRNILSDIESHPSKGWLYLPVERNWNLDSKCAILESDEVPPELEDDPNAGVPDFAKQNMLVEALPITVVKDIVWNARGQRANVKLEDLLMAFQYYYKHDAFIAL